MLYNLQEIFSFSLVVMYTQKLAWLEAEADAWFDRNKQDSLTKEQVDEKFGHLLSTFALLPLKHDKSTRILEVGCGQGLLLQLLEKTFNWSTYGLDPIIRPLIIVLLIIKQSS